MKYIKRAIPVEAVQWRTYGDHPAVEFPSDEYAHLRPCSGLRNAGIIRTLEGVLVVSEGDWVLGPGPAGEYWPVRDDIFRATYEPASEPPR